MLKLTRFSLLTLILAAATLPAFGQCKSNRENPAIAASPSQPTITGSPLTIAPGVGEVEYGWQQAALGGGAKASASNTLYKLGLFCNFELRVSYTAWQSASAPGRTNVQGIGDTWISGQYNFQSETRYLPALAAFYTVKQPTGNRSNGLGSGQRDHLAALSAGKDFGETSFNFETKYAFFGQPGVAAFSRHLENSLNASHPLPRHLSITARDLCRDAQQHGRLPHSYPPCGQSVTVRMRASFSIRASTLA